MTGRVFVYTPVEGTKATLIHGSVKCVRDVLPKYSINCDCYVISEGKVVNLDDILESGRSYTVCLRMRGGKGGFGSMLRAIGAQISKTTNREACRDLSGRRMRDVNNEKKMREYIKKKAEQNSEREQKKKDKLESLTRDPKHFFNDPDYENKLHEAIKNVDKAVEKGILEHSKKRKLKEKGKSKEEPKLKKGLWLGEDDISSGSSDSEDEKDARLRVPVTVSSRSHAGSSEACCSTSGNKMLVEGKEKSEVVTSDAPTTKDGENSLMKQVNGGNNNAISDNDNSTSESGNTSWTVQVYGKSEETESHPVCAVNNIDEIDLSNYNTAEELEQLGLELLKAFLIKFGVKCGGSLKERATRLLLVKDVSLDQIDPSLSAPKSKKRKRKKK